MKREIEILAPAGSMDCLKAAVAAGADAVYVGGSMFGARAYANNFTEEELLYAIDYVHLHGRKLFLTVNTLLKEDELKEKLYPYLIPYYLHGLDAVIVQDIGVLKFVKEHFPGLAIHASTQMTITGVDGAKFLEAQGVDRIVTARELSTREIAKIAEATNVEIESFVHGALCYCYSGQCLFSSFLGGRSGNRGQCAQPCRLLYQAEGEKRSQYLLSLKDICTLELIPEMAEAGIYSFKIEGRMKKPEYVAGVVSMYRKYTDLYLSEKKPYVVEDKDKEMLMDLYNRGGFHTGYYHTQNGKDMVSLSRPNHAGVPAVKCLRKQGRNMTGRALVDLNPQDIIELPLRKGQEKADVYTCRDFVAKGQEVSIPVFTDTPFQKGMVWNRTRNTQLIEKLHKDYLDTKIKEKINGKLILSKGESAKLTVGFGSIYVNVAGDVVQEALNQPMDAARIEKQMRKTGNTEFEFDRLDIEINGNIFIPMQSLNELRRMALARLEEEIYAAYRRKEPDKNWMEKTEYLCHTDIPMKLTASAQTIPQLEILLQTEDIHRIYADCVAFPQIWRENTYREVIEMAHSRKKEIFLIMPYIFREYTKAKYEQGYERIFGSGWDGILIRNYESYGFLKEHGYNGKIITDYNMYQFNSSANAFWKEENISGFTAPFELTAKELKGLQIEDGELVIYGHIPMMVSAGCVHKTIGQCQKKSGQMTISDRYHKSFVVKNECDYCYNVIYNHVPLYLGDKLKEIRELHPGSIRLMFTVEEPEKVKEILRSYEEERTFPEGEFTRGHWKNGIK